MRGPLIRIALLALASAVGIVAMLLVDGAWDWLFLAVAALPVMIGGGLLIARKLKVTVLLWCDQYPQGEF